MQQGNIMSYPDKTMPEKTGTQRANERQGEKHDRARRSAEEIEDSARGDKAGKAKTT